MVTYLAPPADTVASFSFLGRQPSGLSAPELIRIVEQPTAWSASGKPSRNSEPTRVLGTDLDLKSRTPLRHAKKLRRIEMPDICTNERAARCMPKNDLQTGEQQHMHRRPRHGFESLFAT